MNLTTGEAADKANIYYRNNLIYKINDEFSKLTGYAYNDIVGKSINELYKLLKANVTDCFKIDKSSSTIYIFTNKDEPKHVEITYENLSNENGVICFTAGHTNMFLKGVLTNCVYHREDLVESVAIYSYPELIHLKVNDNYVNNLKTYGPENHDLIGSIYSPRNPSLLIGIKENGYYYREENGLVDKEGNTKYWTTKANLIYEDDQAKYLKITFVDETEKVLTRKAIEKQKTKMEVILDNLPASIVKLSNKGEYKYTNKTAEDKLDKYNLDTGTLSNEDIFNTFKYNDINGRQLSFDEFPDNRVLRGETIKDYIMIGTSRLTSFYHRCSGAPIYDHEGNIESAVLIYEDITSEIKSDEYEALSKNLKRKYVNYSVISKNDFKIKYMNEGALGSLKMTHPYVNSLVEVIGNNFFDYYAYNSDERQDVISNVKSCISGNCPKYIHIQELIEEGKVEYIKTTFQPVFDENNEVKEISCIGIYITDEELANREIANSLKAQEEVFVNTSHELKTPINLIFSASQLLDIHLESECSEDKKKKIKHSNKIITQNCYRAIKLINNILDVSKIEQGFHELCLRNMNIVYVLDNIIMPVSDYIKDKKLSIIFDPEIEEKIMGVDIYNFERIMLNLISNAIKFSNDDGVILIKLIDKGASVEISVTDQGIGIHKESLKSIFNKFKQEDKSLNRNTEGTGIGLSLVESIVKLHGGTINVESTLSVGTKFIVNLPSEVVDEAVDIGFEYNCEDRVEMIKFELSDIYD